MLTADEVMQELVAELRRAQRAPTVEEATKRFRGVRAAMIRIRRWGGVR